MSSHSLPVVAPPPEATPGADDPPTSLTLSLPGHGSKRAGSDPPHSTIPFSEELKAVMQGVIRTEVRDYMARLVSGGRLGSYSQEAINEGIRGAVIDRMGCTRNFLDRLDGMQS